MHEPSSTSLSLPAAERDPVDNIFDLAQVATPSERALRAEVDIQISTAKRFPRVLSKFRDAVLTVAELDRDVARSMFYSVPRGGKKVEGPSIRLAELVACKWGNLRVTARFDQIDDEAVVAVATAHDLETNSAVTMPERRSILSRDGGRFTADMINVTMKAAAAIARRNAIFAVVPRAIIDPIWKRCKVLALGKGMTIEDQRAEAVEHWGIQGVSELEMCSFVGRERVDDLTLDDLGTLIGLWTAIETGETSIDAERERVRQEREDAEYAKSVGDGGLSLEFDEPAKGKGKRGR